MKQLALMIVLVAGASPTFASERPNMLVFRDVSKQVTNYAYFSIFDAVHVRLDHGVVTLTGRVTMPYKADAIAARVAKVAGVTTVHNQIEALPVSQFDAGLRLRIARALYAHPALSQYALGANPSIHVIVEHGRVVLDGVVNNDADRLIANAVVRGFTTFGVTNALRTNEELRQELERL